MLCSVEGAPETWLETNIHIPLPTSHIFKSKNMLFVNVPSIGLFLADKYLINLVKVGCMGC